MNPRLPLESLPFLVALGGCAANPPPESIASPSPAPAVSTAAPSASDQVAAAAPPAAAPAPRESGLLRLSQAWAQDPELTLSGNKPSDDLARCPRAQHEPRAESRGLVPPAFVRFEGIATRACDAVLWVYLGCTEADDKGASCLTWKERLVLEPVGGGAADALGEIEPVRGGNSAGLFVPFAFTRGDRWILLRAWMFSPGAGGGAVDYGVGTIARSTRNLNAPIQVSPLPARAPVFYADFGCAIGLAASDKTPTYTQPGHPADNGGALVALSLATLRPRTLLEERDTTYAVDHLDDKGGTLDVAVTKHTFGKDCPRGEGALDCSKSTTAKRRLALPACAP
jgi:hypothetical protein